MIKMTPVFDSVSEKKKVCHVRVYLKGMKVKKKESFFT